MLKFSFLTVLTAIALIVLGVGFAFITTYQDVINSPFLADVLNGVGLIGMALSLAFGVAGIGVLIIGWVSIKQIDGRLAFRQHRFARVMSRHFEKHSWKRGFCQFYFYAAGMILVTMLITSIVALLVFLVLTNDGDVGLTDLNFNLYAALMMTLVMAILGSAVALIAWVTKRLNESQLADVHERTVCPVIHSE